MKASIMKSSIFQLPVVAILLLLLGGCSLFDGEEEDEFANLSTEEQFYQRALGQLNGQNFRGSITTY